MAAKRRRGLTLEEHNAALKASGQYDAVVERARLREAERQARAAEWRKAEQPLVADLGRAGYHVASVWDLVNTKAAYPAALPILAEHLQREYPDAVREGIARALAVPEANFAWDVIFRMYANEQSRRAKDGLACAIAGAASDDVLDEVIALARDPRHGTSRVLLLRALERSRDPRARSALMELGGQEALSKEVQAILRRIKKRKR